MTTTEQPADDPKSVAESDARKTIDHLLNARLIPKTIQDLSKATERAKGDSAIGHLGRR